MFDMIRSFGLRCCTAVFFLCFGTTAFAEAKRDWYTLSIDDQRVGHAWRERSVDGAEVKTTEHVNIEISQFRRRATVRRQVEIVRTAEGRPIRVAVKSEAGADRGAWRGEFDARTSRLNVFTEQGKKAVAIDLLPDLQLSDRLSDALRPLWTGSDRQLSMAYLDVARARPSQLVATSTSSSAEPGIVDVELSIEDDRPHRERLRFDERGNLLRIEQPFFGATLIWSHCTSDCDRGVEQPFDPMVRLTVRSPFRISPSAAKGTIRYVISGAGEGGPRLVETGEQSVVRDGGRAVVTICERCGADAPAEPSDLASYLAPNAWVQSEHPEIVSFARRAAGGGTVSQRMNNLTSAVRARMTGATDFLGYASALEAFRHRSGDCTEFAVLLTAAARSRGIPTRIVIGLVYADRFSGKKDVFSPHAWVQAWDGKRWTSYDAALDGFDSTHIGIAIGDGDPRQFDDTFSQLPLWRIEKAGAVRAQ